MASEYVTLIKNPKRKNPKHRNPKSNPNGVLGDITKPLPNAGTLAFGAAGAVSAIALPLFVRAKSNVANIFWSAVGTLGAGFIAQRITDVSAAKAAVLGGSVVTALKVANVITKGQFGLPPGVTAGAALQPAPAPDMPAGSSGMGRAALNGSEHGVSAFRLSEFKVPAAPTDEPLLV